MELSWGKVTYLLRDTKRDNSVVNVVLVMYELSNFDYMLLSRLLRTYEARSQVQWVDTGEGQWSEHHGQCGL